MVAVVKRGYSETDAWKICRASLKKSGFMKSRDLRRPTDSTMKMTQKGTRRNMKHSMEPGVDKKNDDFVKIYSKVDFRR